MWKEILIAFILLMIAPLVAAAEVRSVHAEWTMDEPVATDLAGFRVYVDNALVIDIADPAARSCDFDLDVLGPEISFTMTSYDETGQESNHSEAVIRDPTPGIPISFTISGI
jgi:hypothetical protein